MFTITKQEALIVLKALLVVVLNYTFILSLIEVAICDIKYRIVKNKHLLQFLILDFIKIYSLKMPSLLFGGLLAVPFLIASIISDNAFGGGDIKLIFLLSIYIGFEKSLIALLITLMLSLCFSFTYKIIKEKSLKSIPMCPFLAVGYGMMLII